MAGFDNILDDVARDFFGDNADKYKDSLISEDLMKMADKLEKSGAEISNQTEKKDEEVPEAVKKATEALNELDQLTINSLFLRSIFILLFPGTVYCKLIQFV